MTIEEFIAGIHARLEKIASFILMTSLKDASYYAKLYLKIKTEI